jgi:peptidoglycan/xylan/chitin deacetylase (PgdA/CDA1 family)
MRRPVIILLAIGALIGALVGAPSAAAAATTTVVSLTFDDGYDNHVAGGRVLAQHGVRGTFYINSGDVGTTRHLTWAQVDQLAADGHEIAGHTVSHVDLDRVSATTARHEICDDRTSLLNRGYAVTNFAYPYGHGYDNPTIRSIVQECGYNSARMAWGIGDGVYAETDPPSDVWAIKSPSSADASTLSQLQAFVTDAETHGGGWVPFYFHDVCNGCSNQAVSESTLSAFLDWLAPRAATGTTVKTFAQVIGGPVQPPPSTTDTTPPVTTISCNAAPCAGTPYTAPVTVELTSTDSGSGVNTIRYTTDGTTPTLSSPAYQSPITVTTTTTVSYAAWDNAGNAETPKTQLIQIQSGPMLTFAPSDDATINAAQPTTNAGTSSRITVDTSPVNDLLLKFTVNGTGAGTGCPSITAAKLRLTVGNTSNDNSNMGGVFRGAANSNWAEGTVTWNTAPAASGTPVAAITTPVALNTAYLVDVTPLVAGNGTFTIRASGNSDDAARYYSRNGNPASVAPQLQITCG